ncbi:hypothetical protein RHMOL_Rhmol07G0230200 [Rhododendron molle]|uniref:Uncharacterized protein n=1 Tax=Rhododendron molle TaxID=49168 RepID=A0ACC0N5F2_RHOML|nr:hypothetical protein RHMOL_Rhmol07G0230200 [Rhododendron molle]
MDLKMPRLNNNAQNPKGQKPSFTTQPKPRSGPKGPNQTLTSQNSDSRRPPPLPPLAAAKTTNPDHDPTAYTAATPTSHRIPQEATKKPPIRPLQMA